MRQPQGPIIEPDPDGKWRKEPRIWGPLWVLIAFGWVSYFATREIDWISIAGGGLTGMALATWAIEVTGNKVPEWMGGKRRD